MTYDICETCNRPVTPPNMGNGTDTHPEIFWDDDLGQSVCERPDCKDHAS